MFGDKPEDYDMVMEDLNQKIKEKINVELDLEIIPQGEYNDKVKLHLRQEKISIWYLPQAGSIILRKI